VQLIHVCNVVSILRVTVENLFCYQLSVNSRSSFNLILGIVVHWQRFSLSFIKTDFFVVGYCH
jgi:hypothetical protein